MRSHAFTIGRASGYDAALAEATPEKPVRKMGRQEDYNGGCVWYTSSEAYAFKDSDRLKLWFPDDEGDDFGVYLLELPASWEASVYGPKEDGVHRLCVDAKIIGRMRRVDLKGCARCDGDGHDNLEFWPFTHAVEDYWTHWALCPTYFEPILLISVPDDEEFPPVPVP